MLVRNALEESRRRDPRAISGRKPPEERCWRDARLSYDTGLNAIADAVKVRGGAEF